MAEAPEEQELEEIDLEELAKGLETIPFPDEWPEDAWLEALFAQIPEGLFDGNADAATAEWPGDLTFADLLEMDGAAAQCQGCGAKLRPGGGKCAACGAPSRGGNAAGLGAGAWSSTGRAESSGQRYGGGHQRGLPPCQR